MIFSHVKINMVISHVKISSFRAKAHLVFHRCLYNINHLQHKKWLCMVADERWLLQEVVIYVTF